MLDNLAPARRRLLLAVVALVVVVAGAVTAVALTRDGDDVTPVAQDDQGPVLLVHGYTGSPEGMAELGRRLEASGRDVVLVDLPGDATGDIRDQAETLRTYVDDALEQGAPSVDVVAHSAGGVVTRWYVAELGGGSHVRRVVTLGSPQHGTGSADLAAGVGGSSCPEACQQMTTDSDLLRTLNRGDETPAGPRWVSMWTEDDQVVVPPDSASLDGAVDFAVQDVCPDLELTHGELVVDPTVARMVVAELGTDDPAVPDARVCG